MNESWDEDCCDEKSKSEDNKKESTCLDVVADIGEGICDIIGSILD